VREHGLEAQGQKKKSERAGQIFLVDAGVSARRDARLSKIVAAGGMKRSLAGGGGQPKAYHFIRPSK
jgi:hypothetical protein